ncbi:MAG: glycosyltransferase family 4 protein [Opitutales bacterium]
MSRLIVTFSASDYTGASRMGFEYLSALRSAGFTLDIVIAPYEGEQTSLRGVLETNGFQPIVRDWFSSFINLSAVKSLALLAESRKASCLISMNQGDVKTTGPAARMAGLSYIAFAQNLRKFHGRFPVRVLKEWGYKREMRAAARVISVSNTVCDEHRNRFGVSKDRSVVVVNGVDLKRFKREHINRSALRRHFNWDDDEAISLNVGRITLQKNQLELVDVFFKICEKKPDQKKRLLFVGAPAGNDFGYFEQLKDKIQSSIHRDKVELLGWRDDIPDLLSASDIYVHPAKWEGWPLAPTEAMAAACPVVMTDCSGEPSGLIQGENCFCTQNGDMYAFSDAWITLLNMSDHDRRELGRKGQKIALKYYDIEKLKASFVEAIQEVVEDV